MSVRQEVRVYVDCDRCGLSEYLGSSPMVSTDIIKMVTHPDREVAVRKDGINIDYYDERVWKLDGKKLICPMCVEKEAEVLGRVKL